MKTLEVVKVENHFEVALVLHDVSSNSRVYCIFLLEQVFI